MTFSGFLVLFDPPKPRIIETITSLKNLGVTLKVITGDNHLVAANVSQQMGLSNTQILTGRDLSQLSDAALAQTGGGREASLPKSNPIKKSASSLPSEKREMS